ncbi:bacteriochlorophyll 4-vinyl reductase [Rossellomorea aquimaris]|uniref:bacteriochlorophyll 4-vinyl reductase n=1 Tax=Rossellomorea aquimaris TaxID=189382 RepID=UPI0037C65FDB
MTETNKLELLIDKSLSLPGVKVSREEFLTNVFSKRKDETMLAEIMEKGPYGAGVSKKEIDNIAKSIIHRRTLTSTSLSFGAGLPGGIAMAGTIPGDVMQFYGIAMRLAQELAYLYGHHDLWLKEHLDTEKARDKIVVFLGVMFGVGGSASAIKFLSSSLSKQVLKKLPQKALTKTLYYPIIKKIAGYIGVKLTKESFAKGISKAIPIVGGVVSGSITYSTMRPMGKRLAETLSDTLVMSDEEIKKEFNALRKEFPEIIDIEFEEVIEEDISVF